MTEIIAPEELTPPPDFQYNPDVLDDYDEQVRTAIAQAAYSVQDFVDNLVPPGEITTIHGDTMQRDKVLGHWALRE